MKSLWLLFLSFSLLFSFEYGLEPKRVGSDVYCFFGKAEVMDRHNNGNMSNSCFVDMGKSYIVIDSGPTYIYAKEAYAAMKKIKDLPISYVIDTHVHDDHWLGNSYYKTLGAKLIGSKSFATLPKAEVTRMQRRISKEAYRHTQQTYPEILVDKSMVLTIGGKKVFIRSVNAKAHTSDDLYVYIPHLKALFAGDLIFNGRLPSLRDGNINRWLETLEELKKIDARYVIGGHGEVTTPKAIDFTYEYLKELKDEVQDALDNGDSLGEAVERITMPEYKHVPFYNSIHRQNVETAYRTLEWEDE